MCQLTRKQYTELNPSKEHGIFLEIFDLNILYEAFKASMKGSAWKEEPQRFEIDILTELVKLKHELESQTYRTSEGIEFQLSERGKTRYIHGLRMRDRVVHHALCDNFITPAISPYLYYNNGASQKGKGITFARQMFERDLHNYWLETGTNDGFVVFFDMKKYYDNIQHKKVKQELYPLVDSGVTWLIDETLKSFEVDVSYMNDSEYENCLENVFNSIVYHQNVTDDMMTGEKMLQKSVNIGDQIAQDIGIFFPTPIDNYVTIVKGQRRYGRYMDDMYCICKSREEVDEIVQGVNEETKSLGLFINKSKTHVEKLSGNYKYLQVRYTLTETGKVIKRINPTAVSRERSKLRKYKNLLQQGKMSYSDIEQAYKSWMGNFVKLMSKKQIKHMKRLYLDLFGKDVRWKKQKSNSRQGKKSK